MKSTDHFKKMIQSYLEQCAIYDEPFAHSYRNLCKNIEDCVTYILNEVQKSGCNGFMDEEIFSLALHYYDEIDLKIGNPITCNIVVNHTVELTAEEKEQARKDAIKRIENEAYARISKSRNRATAKKIEVQPQATLFDF
ncbi:MAG: PcfK-like family protein [Odoribacter sp.]